MVINQQLKQKFVSKKSQLRKKIKRMVQIIKLNHTLGNKNF